MRGWGRREVNNAGRERGGLVLFLRGRLGARVGRGELVLCKTGRRKPPIVRFGY